MLRLFHRERLHPVPVRRQEIGRYLLAVRQCEGDRLPAVGIENLVRGIERLVISVVGIVMAAILAFIAEQTTIIGGVTVSTRKVAVAPALSVVVTIATIWRNIFL